MAIRTKLIQKGIISITGSNIGAQFTITSVDQTKAFIQFTVRSNTSTVPESGLIRARFLTPTDIRFQRIGPSLQDVTIHWTVVEFTSGSNITVEEINVSSISNGTTAAITNVGSTANAFIIASWENSGTGFGPDDFLAPQFNTTSQLIFRMQSGTISGGTFFIVRSNELFVQHVQTADGTTAAGNIDVTIPTPIIENRSMALGYSKNNSGTVASTWMSTMEFASTTILRFLAGDTQAKTMYGQVIQWPSNFVTHWGFVFGTATSMNIAIDAGGVTDISRSYVVDGGANLSNARMSNEALGNLGEFSFSYDITTTTNVNVLRLVGGDNSTLTMWVIEDTGPDVDPGGIFPLINGGLINNGLVNKGLAQ